MGKVSYVLGKAVTFEIAKCSFLHTPRCPVVCAPALAISSVMICLLVPSGRAVPTLPGHVSSAGSDSQGCHEPISRDKLVTGSAI